MSSNTVSYNSGKKIWYQDSGPRDGPLLILVHGWPGSAETWLPQIEHFTALDFRVIAMDTPGYGNSSMARRVHSDYSLESIVEGMMAILANAGREQAIWVGHDWCAPIVWAVAAHHPEACAGVASLTLPYMTLDLGLEELVRVGINRDIHPADRYSWAQWSYMHIYETYFDDSVAFMDEDRIGMAKLCFFENHPTNWKNKPAHTSRVYEDGWQSAVGGPKPPAEEDVEMEITCLTDEIWQPVREKIQKTGFGGADAYYINHRANRDYSFQKRVNGGVLDMPVLYIAARRDVICTTATNPGMLKAMQENCKDVTLEDIDGGHWVHLEQIEEVNLSLQRWMETKLLHFCKNLGSQ